MYKSELAMKCNVHIWIQFLFQCAFSYILTAIKEWIQNRILRLTRPESSSRVGFFQGTFDQCGERSATGKAEH